MSSSTSELRVRLERRDTGLIPPVKYFGASFVDHICYFCLVLVMLSCTSGFFFFFFFFFLLCGHLLGKG